MMAFLNCKLYKCKLATHIIGCFRLFEPHLECTMDIHFITNCEIEPEVDCLIIPAWEGEVHVAINSSLINVEDQTSLNLINERGNLTGKDNFYLPTPMSAYRGILILGLAKRGNLAPNFQRIWQSSKKCFSNTGKHHLLLEMEHTPELETVILSQQLTWACMNMMSSKPKKQKILKLM